MDIQPSDGTIAIQPSSGCTEHNDNDGGPIYPPNDYNWNNNINNWGGTTPPIFV